MALIKVLELVGESQTDWHDAVRSAVEEAAKTVSHITGVEVVNLTADVNNGKVSQYKANIKVAFVVDNTKRKPVS